MKVNFRPLLTVVFLALLALPSFLIQKETAGDASRYGFRFEEVGKAAGVTFTHETTKLDAKLEHIMPQVAAMGASVAVADFDRDGWPDFYATTSAAGKPNALYRNLKDGRFEDVATKMGVADLNAPGTGCATGAIWGDYDNDGFEDLFVYRWGAPALFHNDGGKAFTRVPGAGLPAKTNANSAIWLDYDRDGKLDLFIAGYWDERIDLWNLKDTKIMPESFEYALNGGRKYLLKGRGDGSFEDVTAAMGIDSRRWALATGAADLFGSGYPDIFVANDYGISEIYRNEQGKRFAEVSKETGIGAAPKSGMNVSFGDVFNRGRLAVYVSNISEEGILLQGNNLWVPRDAKGPVPVKYDNMATVLGVELGGWSFGAQFGDLDNDGHLDLYLVNGYVSADPQSSYWYDFSKVAGGHASIISDAANWPPMKGRSLAGHQPKRVWRNDGAGRFADVAQDVGVRDRHDGRAVAMVDLWNRGVRDVLVATQCGPLLVYKNTVAPGRHWIELALEGAGSNRSAIGARVTLTWDGKLQVQEVHGGVGFSSQNDRRLHFGLGSNPGRPTAKIRWPSGHEQSLTDLEPDKLHSIKESR
jgi:hypothetical protein